MHNAAVLLIQQAHKSSALLQRSSCQAERKHSSSTLTKWYSSITNDDWIALSQMNSRGDITLYNE